MMYPILCKVKFESLHQIFAHRQIWVQLGFSIVVNWIVAPLLMVCQSQDPRILSRRILHAVSQKPNFFISHLTML